MVGVRQRFVFPLVLSPQNEVFNYTGTINNAGFFYNFFAHNQPDHRSLRDRPSTATKIRLLIGQAQPGKFPIGSLGGNLPDIQTFDEHGYHLTRTQSYLNGRLDYRTPGDYYLWQHRLSFYDNYNPDPAYIRFFHGAEDSLCIAAIGIRAVSNREWLIFGDMMKLCGWDYYNSMNAVTLLSENGTLIDYTPYCFWINEGSKGKSRARHFWLHIRDFEGKKAARIYQKNKDQICRSNPRLNRLYVNKDKWLPLIYWPPPTYRKGAPGSITGNATQFDPDLVLNRDRWRWRTDKGRPRQELKRVWPDEEQRPDINHPVAPGPERPPRNELEDAEYYDDYGEYDDEEDDDDEDELEDEDDATASQSQKKDYMPPHQPRVRDAAFWDRFEAAYSISSRTDERNSAIHVCNEIQNGFVGPDWANSVERLYCRLRTGKVLPFCEPDHGEYVECFDVEREIVREAGPEPEGRVARLWARVLGRRGKLTHVKKSTRYDYPAGQSSEL